MLGVAPPDWKRYSPDPTPDGEPADEVRPYAPASAPKPVRSLRERTVRRHGAGPVLVRAVAIAVTVGIVGLVGWMLIDLVGMAFEDDAEASSPGQSSAGFAELVEALEEETGSTTVFEAVIYPKYAVVEVPFKPGDERAVRYYWDGDLDETSKGTSDYQPFDLADVDSSLFPDMCDQARRLVEDPKDCYLIVRRPAATDTTPTWISAYISNEFSQGGYIEYDLAGVEVGRQTW